MWTDVIRRQIAEKGSIDCVIRVRAHAVKTQYVDTLADGSLKIDIAAPAEDNRGNLALISFLAEQCDLPVSNVKILSGKTARLKLVRLRSP